MFRVLFFFFLTLKRASFRNYLYLGWVSTFRTMFSFCPLDYVSQELIWWGGVCSPVGGWCCCAAFLLLSRSGKGNLQNVLVQSLAALEIEIIQVLSIWLVFRRKLSFLQSQFEHQTIHRRHKEVHVQIAENLEQYKGKLFSKDVGPHVKPNHWLYVLPHTVIHNSRT